MDLKKFVLKILDSLKKNEITISTEFNNNSEIIDKSKIGGKPYLPKDFIWPYYQGLPLSFLAQINLEEVSLLDKDKLLPDKGILYFFYELETQEWGYSPQSKGCAKVFYFEDSSNFELIDFPKNIEDDYKIPEFKVNFKSNISLPSYEDFDILNQEEKILEKYRMSKNLKDFENNLFDEYSNFYNEHIELLESYTKLLGYPDVIQNSMEEECAAIARGFNMGGIGYPKKYKEEIKKASKDWILLFQMDTIETSDYELMFGDCGHIYFWIKKEDLANKNFENIWLILQCY
ncbi:MULTISPECIES: YwqG family protein [Fusobacterium]|uniref:YwqG family protein n=1 Tax=Fusobacterium TaxID=848 RepID=UPI0022E57361|nr:MULTISPECIES: YwqG family protein [Fusobacterium]